MRRSRATIEGDEIFSAPFPDARRRRGIARHKLHAPDVVITDLIMPEKEGLETIIELREICPGARVIAMSGGGRGLPAGYLNLAKHLGARKVLAKALSRDAVLGAIREVLGTDASGTAAEGA